jgi:hypothetical protein
MDDFSILTERLSLFANGVPLPGDAKRNNARHFTATVFDDGRFGQRDRSNWPWPGFSYDMS